MPQASVYSDTVPSQFVAGHFSTRDWRSGSRPLSVVVLASGHGSNLQAILNRFRKSDKVQVVGVASNNPSAYALRRARHGGVPYAVFPKDDFSDRRDRDQAMADWIENQKAGLVVLAGYLEILSPEFVNQFQNRIINIHPSLLPDFPGLHSIERAYEAGIRKSGITVHFVDEGVDTGPIIEQKKIWRLPWESLGDFERRVHAKEHKLLPKIISKMASGKIEIGLPPSGAQVRRTSNEVEPRHASSYRHA